MHAFCALLHCLQAEEMRRAAEEKQKADDEEAAKWLSMISVEQTVSNARWCEAGCTGK
jgi:hypothetical protein